MNRSATNIFDLGILTGYIQGIKANRSKNVDTL
jgi:hypothetical protein